jgi:hypothetical protein
MPGIPTFLSNKSICVTKALGGGYFVAPRADALAEECMYFKTWDELSAYLKVNFTN